MDVEVYSKSLYHLLQISFSLYVYIPKWKESGSNCARKLKSCNSSGDNWIFTQYIAKSASVFYALTIAVDIYAQMSTCSGCNSVVNVYYYPSNARVANGVKLNATNFIPVGRLSFGSASTEESLTFSLERQFDGFYIAIVEENTCFTLRRLRVSYPFCFSEAAGLVVYPNTPIGPGSVITFASCKANAIVSLNTSLGIVCKRDGRFFGSPQCSCVSGYYSTGGTCKGENTDLAVPFTLC